MFFSMCFNFYGELLTDAAPNVEKFLKPIFPKDEEYNYVLYLFNSFLDFSLPNDRIIIFRGSGCNGKSVFMKLFSLIFGDYNIT